MKKNPGRKDRRWTHKKNRTSLSGKKQAINERFQLWRRNWKACRKIPEGVKKSSAAKINLFIKIMEG